MKTYKLIEDGGVLIGSNVAEIFEGVIMPARGATAEELAALGLLLGATQDAELVSLKEERVLLLEAVQTEKATADAERAANAEIVSSSLDLIERKRADLNRAHRQAIERLRAEHVAEIASLQAQVQALSPATA